MSAREWVRLADNVNTALKDTNVALCNIALDHLSREGSRLAVMVFTKGLTSKDNAEVNRAGYALGRMKDEATIPN